MSEPIFHSIEGVELVTIPVSDYATLLKNSRVLAETQIDRRQFEKPNRSMISRNPQVAVFITEHVGKNTASEVVELCRERFGDHLTPSTKMVYRYWWRLRGKKIK